MIIKNNNCSYNQCNIVENKKAYYNFFIEKKIESGLILKGWEVKSIRKKKVDITNSYLFFRNNSVYLIGMDIQPCKEHDSLCIKNYKRNIKVLLKKKEIYYLYNKYQTKGYTLIALSLYWKKAWCKLTIALGKGKSKKDKRLDIKKKEWNIQKNIIIKKLFR